MLKRIMKEGMYTITSLGTVFFSGILFLLFMVLGLPLLAWQILMANVMAFVIILPIRHFFFKDRPKKQKFKSWLGRLDASSFPSLHATRSGFLVILLSQIMKSSAGLAFLILFAILICYSRVLRRRHDYVDVSVGLLLGVGIGVGILVLTSSLIRLL